MATLPWSSKKMPILPWPSSRVIGSMLIFCAVLSSILSLGIRVPDPHAFVESAPLLGPGLSRHDAVYYTTLSPSVRKTGRMLAYPAFSNNIASSSGVNRPYPQKSPPGWEPNRAATD